MAKKQQRKYVCFDCKHEFFLYIYETYQRNRAHCPRCGSISLDLCPKSLGREEIKSANEIFIRDGDNFEKVKTRKF